MPHENSAIPGLYGVNAEESIGEISQIESTDGIGTPLHRSDGDMVVVHVRQCNRSDKGYKFGDEAIV